MSTPNLDLPMPSPWSGNYQLVYRGNRQWAILSNHDSSQIWSFECGDARDQATAIAVAYLTGLSDGAGPAYTRGREAKRQEICRALGITF